MGFTSKTVIAKDVQVWSKAWDYLNMQVSDCKTDVKNISDFAVAELGNSLVSH